VDWYKKTYNTSCSGFDLNSDGCIDGVWLVYGCPDYSNVASLTSNFWAYTYYDYSIAGQSLTLSNPSAYHYCWASYDFMYEMQDSWGKNKVDAHTYIHETGHLLGLDDYYVASDKATNAGPMGAVDMMDANVIDHDAYSKFSFGWVKPYVVSSSCTIVLKAVILHWPVRSFANQQWLEWQRF
jgi:M6 family metalloprotease-like protein